MIVTNPKGLSFHFSENGTVSEIRHNNLRINMRKSDLHNQPGTFFYLRWPGSKQTADLLGPNMLERFSAGDNSFTAHGQAFGLNFTLTLLPDANSLMWKWQADLVNQSSTEQTVELFCMQDVALKQAIATTMNEYYASQYLERLVMLHPHYGKVACCRQNMKEGGKNPWLIMACSEGANAAYLDGMTFYGKTHRETGIAEALKDYTEGSEYAGESSLLALRSQALHIAAGASKSIEFAFFFMEDHPEASSVDDLKLINQLFENEGYCSEKNDGVRGFTPVKSLFYPPQLLVSEDLTESEIHEHFNGEQRMQEFENDQLLSFFYGHNNHVVLKTKELKTDRPHGHIIQALKQLGPDESNMSTNPFAAGVFNSHLTQGNTNFNSLLSIYSNQFHLASAVGQRVFVEFSGEYHLLGVPSAFEMGLNHCRWIYKYKGTVIQVVTWSNPDHPQINFSCRLLQGDGLNLLVSHHFDPTLNWQFNQIGSQTLMVHPECESMMGAMFHNGYFSLHLHQPTCAYSWTGESLLRSDGREQSSHIRILQLSKCSQFTMSIIASLNETTKVLAISDAEAQFKADVNTAQNKWTALSGGLKLADGSEKIAFINEILPWFGNNALIHFLTPYGLEQFGGAAWGTRDVSQGPIDFLLHLEKFDEARKVLSMIFAHQNPDGGWPQWWMFDRYHHIRAHEAHGDIIYWPVIALSKYISITGDHQILDEQIPFYHPQGQDAAEYAPLSEHMNRLIRMITNSFLPGTALVPFGGGDWNDSLQPVSDELAERMVSSWTVMMNYQAFRMYAKVLDNRGETLASESLNQWSERIKADLNKHLIRDGVVAGYGLHCDDGSFDLLLHPGDTTTGIQYSLLPMNRGVICEIFSAEQAVFHQQIIKKHLLGPDGARLMDKPLRYKGGIQTIFQRAESSTFFGREIGLMYIHEHIRYAEALARTGKADEFLHALLQVVPVQYRMQVSNSDLRQANCYYSSSDIAFNNRYDADSNYVKLHDGVLTFRGGWRVYSSGPGIFIGLVVSALIGFSVNNGDVLLDPVIPASLDGLQANLSFRSKQLKIKYIIENQCFSPKKILINGREINHKQAKNPYRKGGALISLAYLMSFLSQETNDIEITL